ncbi:MAG: hybrid sensor histidine kinase/response regulator [Candidatus Riflebacteria bacterium]|nr:hybrid sensor histidine kinase/response regulator [Candidatus Riflebacteria bacterium]
MIDVEESILNSFVNESREHLETIEKDFLHLENMLNVPDSEIVDGIFRAVHTLKSSASALGFSRIAHLSHEIENILTFLREKCINPEPEVVDALLEGLDFLRVLLDDPLNSEEIDNSQILQRLRNLADAAAKGLIKPSGKTVEIKSEKASAPAPDPTIRISQDKEDEIFVWMEKVETQRRKIEEISSIFKRLNDSLNEKIKTGTLLSVEYFLQFSEVFEQLTEPAAFYKLEKALKVACECEILIKKLACGKIMLSQEIQQIFLETAEYFIKVLENVNEGENILYRHLLEKILSVKPEVQTNSPENSEMNSEKKVSSTEQDQLLIEDFVVEAKKNLAIIEQFITETDASLNSRNFSIITRNFTAVMRALHSIKGGAGFLGLTVVNSLAHAMESVFAALKSEILEPEKNVFSELAKGAYELREMFEDVYKSSEKDLSVLLLELRKLTKHSEKSHSSLNRFSHSSNSAQEIPENNLAADLPAQVVIPARPSIAEKDAQSFQMVQPQVSDKPAEKSADPDSGYEKNIRKTFAEAVKISVDTIERLMMLAGELVLTRNRQLFALEQGTPVSHSSVQKLDSITSSIQETIMKTRMQPMGRVFSKFPRLVRDLARKFGKQIELDVSGNEVEIDKNVLDNLTDPLIHLIRNSCDHGIESTSERNRANKTPVGKVFLRAFHEGGQIVVYVGDDGRGIDPQLIRRKAIEKGFKKIDDKSTFSEKEILSCIFQPGFSTSETVGEISGRGVGMDVVKSNIERIGGQIDIDNAPGKGITFILRLPITLAIIPCLIIKCGFYKYAIPRFNLLELLYLFDENVYKKIEFSCEFETYRLRNTVLPLVRLSEIFRSSEPFNEKKRREITERFRLKSIENLQEFIESEQNPELQSGLSASMVFAVIKSAQARYGLIVDEIIGVEEVVVRNIHQILKKCQIYSGATIMGDGQVALILDMDGIARHAGILTPAISEKNRAPDSAVALEKSYLLASSSENEIIAFPVEELKSVEKIDDKSIVRFGSREYVNIRDIPVLIVNTREFSKISIKENVQGKFIIIPKNSNHAIGISVSEIVDIVQVDRSAGKDETLINGRLVLFPDFKAIVKQIELKCFSENITDLATNQKKSVLLVEDSEYFQKIVREILVGEGYDVDLASDGSAGLQRAIEKKYDMIVSDLEMPEMNGFDFIEKVRKLENYQKIPAIAMSSYDASEVSEMALKSGFSAFQKKLDKKAFLELIRSHKSSG